MYFHDNIPHLHDCRDFLFAILRCVFVALSKVLATSQSRKVQKRQRPSRKHTPNHLKYLLGGATDQMYFFEMEHFPKINLIIGFCFEQYYHELQIISNNSVRLCPGLIFGPVDI